MSRKKSYSPRIVQADHKYQSSTVSKFINYIMVDGKKSIAEKVLYEALDILHAKMPHTLPLDLLNTAIDKVAPTVEVKSRRVGGATYQVPLEVRVARKSLLSMNWILAAARKRKDIGMGAKLAAELADALDNKGGAIKKRDDTHKMAESNKSFSHFRF